jgi:integrase
VLGNGERLPALLNAATGMPLFEPMAYILTQVRVKGAAANTITAHLSAIEILLVHANTCGIRLSERITSGALLDLNELDGLAAAVKLKNTELLARLAKSSVPTGFKAREPTSLESLRSRALPVKEQFVNRQTAGNRMRVIRAYLDWLTGHHVSRIAPTNPHFGAILAKRDELLKAIDARIARGRTSSSEREGLDPEERTALLEIIDPQSPKNPWKEPKVAVRNRLIVLVLYHLGLRGGELLALHLQDLNFRSNTLAVERRPHNPIDPRRIQPTAKTLARVLPMNQGLADEAFAYLAERREIKGSSQHPFVFVETDRGRPLSTSALAKLFRELRTAEPNLLGRLIPHVLRHDWNDRFSEAMDRQKTPEAKEEKYRSQLMGWKEGSGSAATYTKRHTRRKAAKYSLEMQAEAFGSKDDE